MWQNVKSWVLRLTVFLFPLFFLTTTQDFFVTNKLYFLCLAALVLLLLRTFELVINDPYVARQSSLPLFLYFLFGSCILSILLSSPNKTQAVLNPYFGLAAMAALLIISLDLRKSPINMTKILSGSSFILSLLFIVTIVYPVNKLILPNSLQFLKNSHFTPAGSLLDLSIFLGFCLLLQLTQTIDKKKYSLLPFMGLTIVALLLVTSRLASTLSLPPFSYSWLAFVENLKNPLTAIFGVGIDNYATVFTKVKDIPYNQSNIWQTSFFNVSRSTFLHIATESGILGLVSFLLLIMFATKKFIQNNRLLLVPFMYVLLIFALFPPSLLTFFLFFILLSQADKTHMANPKYQAVNDDTTKAGILKAAWIIIIIIFIAISSYFLARSYLAEYYFKKSIDALITNNAKDLYDNQKRAIVTNPGIERFRTNFSQTNLLIANTIAHKSTRPSKEDQTTIAQLIQTAIGQAKSAVALNPQKSSNWENLGLIYRNLIHTVKGSDAWTISAYERAIILDRQNPQLRLNLGGVYYAVQKYDQAVSYFIQAAELKPDWSNAYYNLAWAYFQRKDFVKAKLTMEKTITLIDTQKDEVDYKRAQKDLEKFKASTVAQ